MRWRSAVVSFDGLGPIVSVEGGVACGAIAAGEGVGLGDGCAVGGGEPSNQSMKLAVGDPDVPRALPGMPKALL